MGRFEATLSDLENKAVAHEAVLVGYSGGKDSMAVIDLCLRSFKRVEAFFMYFVPGLECTEQAIREAEVRYGITIRQYPHWLLRKCLFEGVYCNSSHKMNDVPEWKLQDVYQLALADAQVSVLATGAKKSDSLWRRRQMSSWCKEVLTPLREWNKLDVLAYLKLQHLPIPASSGRSATGIDLSTPSLLWLNDTYPDDFKRLCTVFPYAEAVVWRRKFYGIE